MTARHDDDDLPPGLRRAWREGRIVDDLLTEDRRSEEPRREDDSRRDAWLRVLIPILLAAIVAYFTAIGAVRENIAEVKTTEQNHFEEVLRRLELIQRWQDRQDGRQDGRR